MITNAIKRFVEYPLSHFFILGLGLGIFGKNPDSENPLIIALMVMTVLGLGWYTLKAIFIAGSTVKNWDRDHPGEPMFRAGGLTEYDAEKCRQTGAAVAEAIRKSRQNDDGR